MEARQASALVRNASALFGFANKPSLRTEFPKVNAVCRVYEQAGHELVTLGYLRRSTQRQANQEVVPLPFFSVLKRLRPIKVKVIEYLRDG